MKNSKILYRNLNNTDSKSQYSHEENEIVTNADIKNSEEIFYDSEEFLLNNLLMSFQFFENYERDIEVLRKKWFKEMALPNHHKKCFFADSLHKLIGSNIKFVYRHGVKKHSAEFLHPFRIFVSNDNIESAYDPTTLILNEREITPNYQFTVKPCEDSKKDKSGFVFLVELKTPQLTIDEKKGKNYINDVKQPLSEFDINPNSTNLGRKSSFNLRSNRRLTRTEKIIGFQNKESKFDKFNKPSILRNSFSPVNDIIPNNGFYIYTSPKTRLHPKPILDFRMNNIPQTSHSIPNTCFQLVDIKKALNVRRRSGIKKNDRESCFSTKVVLNSAAFKGYFCDLLIERLADSLGLDSSKLEDGLVHEEFIIINNNETINYITPVVEIKDWNKFFNINMKGKLMKTEGKLKWPTDYMKDILHILPCNVAPNGYSENLEENLDYEKEWKIIFPKAEEYLLLHMMHSHLRCFFFVLVIYKSFIELEINSASFSPKHLLHLLFWRVQKDFTAWPEDRPGETLLNFLKSLYKKLQNKVLYDFFITSRNLFENSHLKDLHKVQTIIKRIIENPVPYIMRALKNLELEDDFYLNFDISKLNTMLTVKKNNNENKKNKKSKKIKDQNSISIKDDFELQWRKDVVRQIRIERKLEEQNELSKLSIESINTEECFQMNFFDSSKWCEIIEMFINHFLQMGFKSSQQYQALDQSKIYFLQAKKLINILSEHEYDKEKLIKLKDKTFELSQKCDELVKGKIRSPKIDSNATADKKISQAKIKPTDGIQSNLLKKVNNLNEETIKDEEKSLHKSAIKVIQGPKEKEKINELKTQVHQTKV